MNTINYRALAEDWLDHVIRQYDMIHVCRKDLAIVEYLLKEGFVVVAYRDEAKVLHVDFLGKRVERTENLTGV